ncbi:unnamed protein product, partial [Heterobilharzia americana]
MKMNLRTCYLCVLPTSYEFNSEKQVYSRHFGKPIILKPDSPSTHQNTPHSMQFNFKFSSPNFVFFPDTIQAAR